jgi:flagellar basal-body rod protein FlgB
MDLITRGPDLFDLIGARSRWLAERHGVLSRNIANADTPGFVPLDLSPFDLAQALTNARRVPGLGLERTASSHIAGTARPAAPGHAVQRTPGWELAPSGNAVVLEEQAQKLATTRGAHELAANLYGKYLGMMRTALGVGKG